MPEVPLGVGAHPFGIESGSLEDRDGEARALAEDPQEQVLGLDLGVVEAPGLGLGEREGVLRPRRELLEAARPPPPRRRRCWCVGFDVLMQAGGRRVRLQWLVCLAHRSHLTRDLVTRN